MFEGGAGGELGVGTALVGLAGPNVVMCWKSCLRLVRRIVWAVVVVFGPVAMIRLMGGSVVV